MKKLDAYIIKSFLRPFLATFFIILFVLVMQFIWLGFDEISGKGVDVSFILKFVFYTALTVVPMAMPIGILLSSIMVLGNFGENYEFAAVKSAGISLRRFIAPIVVLTVFLSGINFLFLDSVFPYATLKQKNMFNNVKKKQPALALVPGTFNTEIPGYIIKFDEKYGSENNLLKNVQIADLSSNVGKVKVITAKEGEIITKERSKYMALVLKDGNYYEEYSNKRDTKKDRQKMPASKATFDTYTINIDVSSFNTDVDKITIEKHQQMLSLNQLKHQSDTLKIRYDNYQKNRSLSFFVASGANNMKPKNDTIKQSNLKPNILDNFDLKTKINVLNNATQFIDRQVNNSNKSVKQFKDRRKFLNLYDHEYHNRISFSLACLVLFFIGAPLGSIIRKGGFGFPMVFAIVIFVIYFFISQFAKNLAEESAISAILGGWLSTIILLPFGILLTRRAAKDMGIFDLTNFLNSFKNLFKRLRPKRLSN